VLQNAPPSDLAWKNIWAKSGDSESPFKNMTACFDAVSAEGQLYSINVLNGIVLLDGEY